MSMGDSVIDGKMYEEYNPQLRVDENVKGVQSQLNYLSSKCGLGEKYYNFEFDIVLHITIIYIKMYHILYKMESKNSSILVNFTT